MAEQKESKTGIFLIDKSKAKDVTNVKTFYTILGQQDKLVNKLPIVLEDGNTVLARKDTNGEKNTYFIKVDNLGNLYNPIGLNNRITLKSKLLKEEATKFIKVNELCFNYYLEFLKTKNVLFLKHASRER